MAIGLRRRRNLIRSRFIRTALSVAFGSFSVGFILMFAQPLSPNRIDYMLSFIVMAGIPSFLLLLLNRVPAREMPKPDPDTLINIAGLLVTSAGFNLIPMWKWLDEALKTPDGWLTVPLPEPDFSLPSLVFTILALGLSSVALFRGLGNPDQKIVQARATIGQLKKSKVDLLNVIRKTNDSPQLSDLQEALKKRKYSKDPEEYHEELQRILREYVRKLPRNPPAPSSLNKVKVSR